MSALIQSLMGFLYAAIGSEFVVWVVVLVNFFLLIGNSMLFYAFHAVSGKMSALNPLESGKTLLVIAHPDDECVFFAPMITALVEEPSSQVSILAISNGNADGLGKVREKELVESGKLLGIPEEEIFQLDESDLQDGMENVWDPEAIGKIIAHHVESHGMKNVKRGVKVRDVD